MESIDPIEFANMLMSQPSSLDLGLYIHIPFCHVRCHFCAFYLREHQPEACIRFVDNLQREVEILSGQVGLHKIRVDSVYFGGGTPTTLDVQQLCRILDILRARFLVSFDAEVSVEAHPNSVDGKGLSELRAAGFTRISFGVQSLVDVELSRLGGKGTSALSCEAVRCARQAGFENINIDLMYGLPGQTPSSWEYTINRALSLQPSHFSCYALTVEPGTQFSAEVRRGTLDVPDPTLQCILEEMTVDRLSRAGYERYEVSNYCRAGFACQHNLRYWQGQAYLGFGPSAQSYVQTTRFGNASSLEWYGAELSKGRLPIEGITPLSPSEVVRDALIFGLRLIDGVPLPRVTPSEEAERERLNNTLWRLKADYLIETHGDRIRLTNKGRRFADSIGEMLYHSWPTPLVSAHAPSVGLA